jgi:hypothetical protein
MKKRKFKCKREGLRVEDFNIPKGEIVCVEDWGNGYYVILTEGARKNGKITIKKATL